MNKAIRLLLGGLLVLLAVFGGWKLLANFQYQKGLQAYEDFSFGEARMQFSKVTNYPEFLGKECNRCSFLKKLKYRHMEVCGLWREIRIMKSWRKQQ